MIEFVSLFSPIIEKTDYQRYEGAAYCEGPLLFPAPLDQTIRVTIDIDYTGTLKNKTFTLENIPLERGIATDLHNKRLPHIFDNLFSL